MAGGVPRFVPLRPPDWTFDPAELAAAFNARTRLIVVNTPHNPTGRVFTAAELDAVAELCQKWNVVALCDEVYEHIVFSGARHLRLAQRPGMAERTLTISSHGKTFSFTGWKIGWVLAPPDLTLAVRRAHQFITFASPTPFQAAAAVALGLDDEYYASLAGDYQAALRSEAQAFADDVAFCRWLTTEAGVAAIPPSAFFSDANKGLARTWARFAFCKQAETLERAAERLQRLGRGEL
jgi:N-succinyldiaminopimelate aminotransferase